MSLSKSQILFLVEELFPLVKNAQFETFHPFGSSHYILLVHKGSVHYPLLFCFKTPFVRFHLASQVPAPSQEDAFSKAVNHHLQGSTLHSMEVLNDDRIVQWTFQKGQRTWQLIGEFFSKRPNCYLAGESQAILAEWHVSGMTHYRLPDKPFESGTPLTTPALLSSAQLEILYREKERAAAFQNEKNRVLDVIRQKLKRYRKQHQEALSRLELAQQWPSVHHLAELLVAHMYRWKPGLSSITVQDWEHEGSDLTIALDPSLPLTKEIEAKFRQSKKGRLSIPYLQAQISKLEQDKIQWERDLEEAGACATVEALAFFVRGHGYEKKSQAAEAKAVRIKRALPYWEYLSSSGLVLWVGRTAKDNEKLTFSHANGLDWWLHVQGYPGSHVVIKAAKNAQPDYETVQDALQLALAYSKAKDRGEADIIVTQVKYVSRYGKGQPGKVQVSKHKVMHAKSDAARIQQIKQRKINLHP